MLMWARVVGFVWRRLDVTSRRHVSVLIFVMSQLVDVTEERLSNRCLCWYAKVPSKERKAFLYSHFSFSPLSFFIYFHYLSLFRPFSSRLLSCSPFFFLSLSFPLQGVVAAERTRGGQLLEEPKMLPFRANTFSLQVSIQDVPQFLWSIKPFTTCQVTMAVTDNVSDESIDQILKR